MASAQQTRHTPGPWEHDGQGIYIFGPKGEMVAQVRGWGYLTGVGGLNLPEDKAVEIQKANGNLLAAAPEMFDALRDAVAALGGIKSPNVPDSVRAAIAKAESQ